MGTFQIYGDYIGDGLNTTAPAFGTDQIKDGNNKALPLVQGRDNILGTNCRYVVINGDSNVVCDECENIIILNSSGNIVNAGLSNVTLINTYNLHATSGNIYYVNGIDMLPISGNSSRIKFIYDDYEMLIEDETLFVTTGDTDLNLVLSEPLETLLTSLSGKTPVYNIKKIDDGIGRVVINFGNLFRIEFEQIQYLKYKGESVTLQYADNKIFFVI